MRSSISQPDGGTVGTALVELLALYGVDTIFGIPGSHTVELYRGIEAVGVRHVIARHEQGAALMADGYAWATGRPGVCFVIGGPGLTNTVTGVAQAYRDSRPLLVVSSVAARPSDAHGLPDQCAVTRSITAFSEVARGAAELANLVAEAFRIFTTERPRPCHIAVTQELLSAPSIGLAQLPIPSKRRPDSRLLNQAVELLARAKRPMIVLGGGAVDAGDAATTIASATGAGIVVTGNAKGAVDPRCEYYRAGGLSSPHVLDELEQADVVLAAGTELADTETIPLNRRIHLRGTVIRVDLNSYEPLGHGDTLIQADASLTLFELSRHLAPDIALDACEACANRLSGAPEAPDLFQPWLAALSSALPARSMVALDSTQLAYHAHRCVSWYGARTWFAPFSYGALGSALPLAIGARAGRPDREAYVIVGDAGVLFSLAELATSVEFDLPTTVIIWNNNGFGEVRDAMAAARVTPVEPRSTFIDYVSAAIALGCQATRVMTPDALTDALLKGRGGTTTSVIEVQPRGGSVPAR